MMNGDIANDEFRYSVKVHTVETINFKYDQLRPFVKRTYEETYSELSKEMVLEQVREILDIPFKKVLSDKDLDISLRNIMSDKERAEFIENNNRLFDNWRELSRKIEEWFVLFSDRSTTNFKKFVIDLEEYGWVNKSNIFGDKNVGYLEISSI